MKRNAYLKILIVVVILLAIFTTKFGEIADFYFRRPTIVILAFAGIIILIYMIVFFKQIFMSHKSDHFSKDPQINWETLTFDEKVLEGLTDRQRAEKETARDLIKPVQQLVSDVHEETHNRERNDLENIASAQKRMVSLMARVAISNDKLSKKIFCWTIIMAVLTLAIGFMTYLMVVNIKKISNRNPGIEMPGYQLPKTNKSFDVSSQQNYFLKCSSIRCPII